MPESLGVKVALILLPNPILVFPNSLLALFFYPLACSVHGVVRRIRSKKKSKTNHLLSYIREYQEGLGMMHLELWRYLLLVNEAKSRA